MPCWMRRAPDNKKTKTLTKLTIPSLLYSAEALLSENVLCWIFCVIYALSRHGTTAVWSQTRSRPFFDNMIVMKFYNIARSGGKVSPVYYEHLYYYVIFGVCRLRFDSYDLETCWGCCRGCGKRFCSRVGWDFVIAQDLWVRFYLNVWKMCIIV